VVRFEYQLGPGLLLGRQLRLLALQLERVQVGCLVAAVLLAACHGHHRHHAADEVLFETLVLVEEY